MICISLTRFFQHPDIVIRMLHIEKAGKHVNKMLPVLNYIIGIGNWLMYLPKWLSACICTSSTDVVNRIILINTEK